MKIKAIFGHLKTILTHKWWVLYYCCRCGIPWRGITHDLSKFSPTEFFESVKYYTGTRSPIDACKEDKGYSKAWLHHKGRNKHHYEYWQDNFDKGGTCIVMPYKDSVEMLCDSLAAGRTYMKGKFSYEAEYEWWMNKISSPVAMHPINKSFMTAVLDSFREKENRKHMAEFLLAQYVIVKLEYETKKVVNDIETVCNE